MYLPGDTMEIRITQQGREPSSGVGYLQDGTKVVVVNGADYLDSSVEVEVLQVFKARTVQLLFAQCSQ